MCIITAPHAVVYPLAVVIASINTIIALCGRLTFVWYVYWKQRIHTTLQWLDRGGR